MVKMWWHNSKMETKEYSTPEKEERDDAGTRVWESCWVVRSYIQRPRRERERNVKSVREGMRRGVVVVEVRGRTRERSPAMGVGEDVGVGEDGDGERTQSERTTRI